jgi:pimeloyl-ACP methyl ester carboxylesterase
VHGWPENWYAWRLLMPALARDFEVIAVDQRGIGLTDKPQDGYDTGTLAGDLVALMDALGHERFAVVGHDTGFIISYVLAADHPDRVDRLAVAEVPGPPGVVPSPPLFVPAPLNDRLWHIPFNRVNDKLTEELIRGREDIFFGYEFAIQGGTCPTMPSGTTSVSSPTPTPCAAASGSIARGTPPSHRTSSARPGGLRCPSWQSVERQAGVKTLGTR